MLSKCILKSNCKIWIIQNEQKRKVVDEIFYNHIVKEIKKRSNNKIKYFLYPNIYKIKAGDFFRCHYDQFAGTVGYMFCKIIGVKEKKLILGGIQLGIAMQLTNISRDVAEDLKMNRVYLPKSIAEILLYRGKFDQQSNIRCIYYDFIVMFVFRL